MAAENRKMVDGRLVNWKRRAFSADGSGVLVTPLQPPFPDDVVFFKFETGKELAVSKSDADRIKALLSDNPRGRTVVLDRDVDPEKIRVYLSQ